MKNRNLIPERDRRERRERRDVGHRLGAAVLVASVAASASLAAACDKTAETEAKEAAQASAVATEKAEHAQREAQRGDTRAAEKALEESRAAAEKAEAEHDDVAEAVDRERTKLTTTLTKEIAWVDKRLVELGRDARTVPEGAVRDEKMRDVQLVTQWRDKLQLDLETLQNPPKDLDWTTLKARIQSDLDEHRPTQIPHPYEKQYGI